MNSMRKQVIIIVLGLMSSARCVAGAPYKEEARDMVPGAVRTKHFEAFENYKPFGGERVDYIIDTLTDMMDVQGGRVHTYLFVQIDPTVKKDILAVLDTYKDQNLDDSLIQSVAKSNPVAAKVLKDFKKMQVPTVEVVILSLQDDDTE